MKAKKVETNAVDPMAAVMQMMQAQQEQIKTLSAALANLMPGNAMMTVPAGVVEKKPQGKETEMVNCNLETGTDPGYPYFAIIHADGARSFISNDDARLKVTFGPKRKVAKVGNQDVYRNAQFLNLSGQFPLYTVFEAQGGYGKEYTVATKKGMVALENYERALQVAREGKFELK